MENLFYNHVEKRIRTGWRILIQIALTTGIILGLAYTNIFNSVSLPLARMEISFMLIIVSIIWLMGRFLDKRNFTDFGLHISRSTWWRELLIGIGLGSLEAACLVFILCRLNWVQITTFMGTPQTNLPFGLAVAVDILTFASVGLMEELIRAYQARNLAEGLFGPHNLHWKRALFFGAIGASLFSTLMHINQQGVLFWVYVFLNSMIYCLMFFTTKRIAIAIGAHLAWDFFISTIFSLGGTASVLNAAVVYSAPLTSAGETASNMTLTTFIGLGLKVLGLFLVMFYIKRHTGQKPQLKKEISQYIPAIEQENSVHPG